MRVAIYARVSTEDQKCDLQLRELREYVSRRGWELTKEYVDTGWSGKLNARPALNKLKDDARIRRFDIVVVWKLDRWGRSLVSCIESIQELTGLGVRFIAVTQNLDTDTANPMATFMLHIMAAFAQLEREMIRERVIAGINAAHHRGVKFGRPKVIYSKKKALAMRAEGATMQEIAKKFKVGLGTIHRMLHAEKAA